VTLPPNFIPVDKYDTCKNTTITTNRTNNRRRFPTKEDRELNQTERNWEWIILENATITDRQTLKNLYYSNKDIHITTDGGVFKSQGTFGVVISDKESPALVNYRKLYSPPFYESSFRSEAYGMLAGLKTFKYASNEINLQLSRGRTIIILCDNKSVIKRINERCTTRITINQHYYADVDIELQILA
jgi:hypothetical protein